MKKVVRILSACLIFVMLFSIVSAAGYGVIEADEPMFIDIKTGQPYNDVEILIDKISNKVVNIMDIYQKVEGTDKYAGVIEMYQAKKKAFVEFLESKGVSLSSAPSAKKIQKAIFDHRVEFVKVIDKAQKSVVDSSGKTYAQITENVDGSDNNGEDGENEKPVKYVKIDLDKYPKPLKASTYLYDELTIHFNKVLSTPNKSNFSFSVNGQEIAKSAWTISPSGEKVSFRFHNQNLHGKKVVCVISGVKSAWGESMLGKATVITEFKDIAPIKFKRVQVENEKTFKAYLTTNMMTSGKEGHEVYSDGKLLKQGKDYDFGWLSDQFKIVFRDKSVYPKEEARLVIWGYMTSPYHKFMEGKEEVVADFTEYVVEDIPVPPVPEPEPSQIICEKPDPIDNPILDQIEEEADVAESNCTPAVVYDDYCGDGVLTLYTTKPIKEVSGVRAVSRQGEEISVRYEVFRTSGEYEEFYGFKVYDEDGEYRLNGATIYIDEMIEVECGAKTPAFEYKTQFIIN